MKEMSDDNSPAEVLSWHLSEYSNDYVFGKTDNPTSAAAHEQSKQRATRGGGRTISIYIVSASTTSITTTTSIINTTTLDQNNVQEQRIAGMWSAVPSRVFVIGKDAFFPNEEKGQPPHPCGLVAYSRYHDTLAWRVDHLALLAGAVHMYGHPVLVFDASRQPKDVTYTSTNSNGKILDVGIPVGIGKGQQYVIRNWLRKASSAEVSSFSSQHFSKFNTERRVLCNRGDDSMISQLQPAHGQRYMVEASNHFLHYGITCVLVRQVGWRDSSHRSPPAIFAADLSLSGEFARCLYLIAGMMIMFGQ